MVHVDSSRKFWTVKAPQGTIISMKAPRFAPVKTSKGWRLNVPAALSANKKRCRLFFPTRERAEGRATELRATFLNHGRNACVLPPAQADAASRAFSLLAGHGGPEILIQAATEFLERHNTRANSVTFDEAFRLFERHQVRSAAYAQSLRQYRTRLTTLQPRLLCEISVAEVEQAMAGFPPTVFNYGLRILGGVFNYGRKRGWCGSNIASNIDRKTTLPKDVRVYSPQEAADLLAASHVDLIPWLSVCLFAGLRGSEARQIRWHDCDFEQQVIRVSSVIAKNHQPRLVPMEPNLCQWLLPYRGSPSELVAAKGKNVLRKLLRGAHKDSGVALIKHGARHSYASYLLKRDGSIDALRLNLGHTESSDMTFEHYATQLVTKKDAAAFWSIVPVATSEKIVAMA